MQTQFTWIANDKGWIEAAAGRHLLRIVPDSPDTDVHHWVIRLGRQLVATSYRAQAPCGYLDVEYAKHDCERYFIQNVRGIR